MTIFSFCFEQRHLTIPNTSQTVAPHCSVWDITSMFCSFLKIINPLIVSYTIYFSCGCMSLNKHIYIENINSTTKGRVYPSKSIGNKKIRDVKRPRTVYGFSQTPLLIYTSIFFNPYEMCQMLDSKFRFYIHTTGGKRNPGQ